MEEYLMVHFDVNIYIWQQVSILNFNCYYYWSIKQFSQ